MVFVAQYGNGAMKKVCVALLVAGTVLVAAVNVWVGSYTKKVDAREKLLLQQQQDAYTKARDRRISDWRAQLTDEALRGELDIADQPSVELRITHQELKEGDLLGVVEVSKPATPVGESETTTHKFRIEFDDDNTVRTCEIVDQE